MDHFVRIITTKQEGISSINESVFPDQYLYESEDECVLELPLPRALSEEESDVFAEKLSNLLFAEGYENFDLEFSTDELEEGNGNVRKGVAILGIIAALLGVNKGMTEKAYDNSEQLRKLTAHLQTAVKKEDERMIDQLTARIKNHKTRLDLGKGDVMGKDGRPIDVVYDKEADKYESAEEITLDGDQFFESYGWLEHSLEEAEYQGRKVKLNNPVRSTDGPKKFHVYVKDGDRVKKVNFGDPNMEIKRDNPERRKSFRARHNCDNPGPKTKARYWSCKKW